MSLWSRIADALTALRSGESLGAVFERLRTPPEQSVGFAIAVIALGAKMAKADGRVSRSEVAAFREIFHIAKADEPAAARVFNLARQDVAGFEEYARRIAKMFGPNADALRDLLEGLLHIALADGTYHTDEDIFLARVAEIFGLSELEFARLKSASGATRQGAGADPFAVLGISADATLDEARSAWRKIVRDCHPDRLIARGLPEEAVKLSEKRLIAANRAWEEISQKG